MAALEPAAGDRPALLALRPVRAGLEEKTGDSGVTGTAKMLVGGGEAERARRGSVAAAAKADGGVPASAAGADRGMADDDDVCRSGCRVARMGGGWRHYARRQSV
jgi:hypothetical protein